ncbi:hypothetical protein JX265_003648 [Neoarthrinium moseri]|uniref:Uncharacterized protein n=1 Tax=Neoarthrinium moseri TaxID=1658444 RepID=A0A9Q0ASF0_9PEZI|nr:hypothetical protein JX265_003648 [Neoarthrinium moseri]
MVTPLVRAAWRRKLAELPSLRPPRSRFQSTGPGPKPTPPKPHEAPAPNATTTHAPPASPPSIWQRLGPVTRAANAYSRANQRRPWVTQVTSSLIIFLLADLNAQRIGGKEYDPVRTRNMLITGAVFSIPAYEWFKALSGWFVFRSFALSVVTRVIFNQFTFAPLLNTYFFSMQAFLTGGDIVERIKEKVPVTWTNSWKLWPAVIAFNLAFVPIQFRGVVAGVASVGWQTYLSIQNKKAEMEEAKREATEPIAVLGDAIA